MSFLQRRLRSHSSQYDLPDSEQNAKDWQRGFSLWRWQQDVDRQKQHDRPQRKMDPLNANDQRYLQEWMYLQRVDHLKFQKSEHSFLYRQGFAVLTRMGFEFAMDTHNKENSVGIHGSEWRETNKRVNVIALDDEEPRLPLKKARRGPPEAPQGLRLPLGQRTAPQGRSDPFQSNESVIQLPPEGGPGQRSLPLTPMPHVRHSLVAATNEAGDSDQEKEFEGLMGSHGKVLDDADTNRCGRPSTSDAVESGGLSQLLADRIGEDTTSSSAVNGAAARSRPRASSWNSWFKRLVQFKAKFGHINVPACHHPVEQKVQTSSRKQDLTVEQHEKLVELGLSFLE